MLLCYLKCCFKIILRILALFAQFMTGIVLRMANTTCWSATTDTQKAHCMKPYFFICCPRQQCKWLPIVLCNAFSTRKMAYSTYFFLENIAKFVSNSTITPSHSSPLREMSSMFQNCQSLTELDLSSFDTKEQMVTVVQLVICSTAMAILSSPSGMRQKQLRTE